MRLSRERIGASGNMDVDGARRAIGPGLRPGLRRSSVAGTAVRCRQNFGQIKSELRSNAVRFCTQAPDLVNGGEAEIVEIGYKRVRFRDGEREFSIALTDPQLRHLDHAYCSTVHSAQGRTARGAIAVLDAGGWVLIGARVRRRSAR